MIRGSILVAAVAVLLSVIVHGLGLRFTAPEGQAPPASDTAPDLTDVGGAFEDFADTVAEATVPEPSPVPDPPDVTAPEQAVDEVPTSRALVASDNPQNVTAPDTGSADVIEPDAAGSSGTDTSAPDAALGEAAAPDPSHRLAAPDVQQPDLPEKTIASAPDDVGLPVFPENENQLDAAVTKSLRPPKERPSAEALALSNAAQPQSAGQGVATGVIESPLAIYKRNNVDLLALGGGGSGSVGFSGSRGPGNASATNYAGRVLVQLNRAPVVYASARGMAHVSFEINPDGSLAWVRVLRSTGSEDIRRAARAQVRSAAPFPRPPKGASRRLAFVYNNR